MKALEERSGTPVNVADWVSFFAFDTMGRVAYDHDFGMLHRGRGTVEIDGKTTSIAALHATTKVFGILGPVPWLIKMIIQTNLASQLAAFQHWCHNTMRKKQQVGNPSEQAGCKRSQTNQMFDPATQTPTNMASWLLSSHHIAPDPTRRQSQRSLENDSIMLIMAGSDTTASAITNALFYLTCDRPRFLKLRALVDALPDSSARSLASVHYLDHIINETLRLKPPACEGLVRETPAAGITIPSFPGCTDSADVFVPGGTIVSVPTWQLHRDHRFWGEDADAFRPERFEGVNVTAEAVPFVPFTKGAYACPGKAVGYVEMRAVIAGVVGAFDVEFAEGQGERAFDEGCLDTFTLTNPELMVVLKRRR